MDAGAKHRGGVELAKERKMKAQEALRISELEISLCKWQRRLHEMERRLQHCEETEVSPSVAHAAPIAQTRAHTRLPRQNCPAHTAQARFEHYKPPPLADTEALSRSMAERGRGQESLVVIRAAPL